MNICIYGAASKEIGASFKEAGRLLGRLIAEHGCGLVFGGGDNGMMGAVARGAHECGGHVISIAPSFFNVDGILYPLCDEFIYTETMRERKQLMEDKSGAFIVTPGGIGTLEEFLEVLTLKQLGRMNKPIVILNTDGCYDPLIAMLRHTVDLHFMTEHTFGLFFVADTPQEAIDYIENYEAGEIDPAMLRNLK